ncbi:MAG TPA: YdcF family protein [Xanthobacteraceae bacterium]|nr:YdcF family protein [Xanthobacteraceae bacterium]
MFFILSKILGFFALPSNFLIVIGLVGLVLLLTRFTRLASWLVVTSLVLIAVAGLSPLGNALILPLEQRFPPWDSSLGPPDGIVVLGGAISPAVSAARGAVALDEAAERITVTAELARRYPNARIVFSGGSNALIFDEGAEAAFAVQQLQALGVAQERLTAEEQSRNTIENAVFSRLLANPRPGERWLLVTSAYHMPRAMAAFRAAGFLVEAYPVDWRTRGLLDAARPFASLGEGLRRTDTAVREWVGLLFYRLAGKTSELFPGP